VKNTHEATLDSKLLVLSSDLGLQKARRMKLGSNCFDTDDFILKICYQLRINDNDVNDDEGCYDWKTIGKHATQATLRVPSISFM
jgi:hypothetical protein